MTELPAAAKRVEAAALALGLRIEVRTMPASTRTAAEAAAGTPYAVFAVAPEHLRQAVQAQVIKVT